MLTTLAAVVSLSLAARLCEVVPSGSDSTAWMREATFVARARVVAPDTTVPKNARQVRFEIEEVLRSTNPPPIVIALQGYTVDRDDFNKRPVPYDQVRPSGLRGSCFADEYRIGADYLLLLIETKPGVFSSHWAPLLPVNEELHGADDPWLAWVRGHIAR